VPLDEARLRPLNDARASAGRDYVLYWIQSARRLERSHALDYALERAAEMDKPLVVYEGLRLDYPWASQRLHRFILEGMVENVARARALGLNYWPFVETPENPARGLLRRLVVRAALVVTDDFPCFVVPGQSAALARQVDVPVVAVDGNGVVPLVRLGAVVSAAAHLRPRVHRAFAGAWAQRAAKSPRVTAAAGRPVRAPFPTWRPPRDLDAFLATLPLDASVPAVAATPGGRAAARQRLRAFVAKHLEGYAETHSCPAPPQEAHSSGLSPYLHFGHISVEEVVEAVGKGGAVELRPERAGRREFFGDDPDANAFLDEALVWRDVGFLWQRARGADAARLATALPAWALATLEGHSREPRSHVYTAEEWENGQTHDPLWNAAQQELVATGTMHNYLRMLWGKKALEWSRSPEQAYATLVHLNNKYALDGRDPNSYSGILWCFGLFDRPWPERKVFGMVRYMSSENTARKFRLGRYLEYVASLPTIAEVRGW
jgi:deoxyribodipyrimidine photo-lyase